MNEEIGKLKEQRILTTEKGFSVEYYCGETIMLVFINVGEHEHITLILEKGLIIVGTEEDVKFSCHIKDFISLRN